MNAPERPDLIEFQLDGRTVTARPGESLLHAAERHGTRIPRLCAMDGLRPDGNCRACVVEIEGERTLAPSCSRSAQPGMKVRATSERALKSQAMVLELLLADRPDAGHKWLTDDPAAPHGELSQWAAQAGVTVRPALKVLAADAPAADLSHPAMAVQLDACIQCTRCVRACREVQVNGVIGMAGRGSKATIVFDLADPMGESTCVACGECVQACPTGALMPKTHLGAQSVDKSVDSVCPFCGVGCLLTYHVKDKRIVSVSGRDGPANAGRLCVKGRFGFDYAASPDRLTRPLIRREGVKKDPAHCEQHPDWREVFREATWDEALDVAARGLNQLKAAHGAKSLAGFGSAKGSNEEAYLFQKLVRTGFGSNNVDHCTRLCHASSVAALLEGVGSGAVSNPVRDVEWSDFILVIGANPTANHPVGATWMKNAAERGAKLVLADPRRTELSRLAWRTLQFKPGSDVAMVNALLHVIVNEGLVDHDFVRTRVDGFDALAAHVQAFSPEAMAPICGIDAATLREVARAYATSPRSIILWGMGVSQHVHGTDNVRALIALASISGQIGRPGTGLHPLRGQNNVQGASDAGLIPMMFPNYQRVSDPAAHAWFESFWGQPLDKHPGYTVVELMNKALADDSDPHKLRGLYIMGENPAMSDPDLSHTRHALASLQHLVVQDIFLTETAWLADVILPTTAWPEKTGSVSNTDRMVQLGRAALTPPVEARADLWIIQQLAQRMGLDWRYDEGNDRYKNDSESCPDDEHDHHGVAAVYDEMRQAMHAAIGGITWDRLVDESSVTYPCATPGAPSEPIVFTERFPTANGRVRLVPVGVVSPDETPDADYPLVLITGRQLEHWHTGAMTRRATVLDAIEPAATVSMHSRDMARLGLQPGACAKLETRRGSVTVAVRQDDGTQVGSVFLPFAYREAAANLLTNAALDPYGKIPEFKYCAVRVSAA